VTTPATGPRAETGQQSEARMRAVAAELGAAGLDAVVYQVGGVFDVRATLRREGHGPVEITYDTDGYVQATYWNAPGAMPAQVAAIITGVPAVITHGP
jgi:hypothetical protein